MGGSTVVVGAGSQLVNRSFAESGVKALVLGRDVAVSDYSFQRCYKLHSLVSSTNDFGQGAFSACKGLLNVIMTEPMQLNTKHRYSWRRGGLKTPKGEVFSWAAPKIQLLTPGLTATWARIIFSRKKIKAFNALALAVKRRKFTLHSELFLEIIYTSFFLE